jgi:cytoskeletal protein RodZ
MTVSEQLRTAREARHLSIAQVAEITKLRSDHVRALEEGRFDVFSAPVYVRGFVRTYSTLLKMDVPRVMAALDGELGGIKKFVDATGFSDEPSGMVDSVMLQFTKLDWRKSVLGGGIALLMIIVVAGYFSWRHWRSRDPFAGVRPALHQSPTNSGELLPLTSSPAPPAQRPPR